MAEKDLQVTNVTIRESGADQLHLAGSVGVLWAATLTEDSLQRSPVEFYYIAASQGGQDV